MGAVPVFVSTRVGNKQASQADGPCKFRAQVDMRYYSMAHHTQTILMTLHLSFYHGIAHDLQACLLAYSQLWFSYLSLLSTTHDEVCIAFSSCSSQASLNNEASSFQFTPRPFPFPIPYRKQDLWSSK